MQLGELIPRGHVLVPLEAKTPREAMAALADRLARAGALRDPAAVEALPADEDRRGTVLAGDLALILHARIDAVERLVVGLGVAPEPIRLSSEEGPSLRDGGPRIVVVVLAPPGAAPLYLQTVATLERVLRSERIARALIAAKGPEDVVAIRELVRTPIQSRLTARDLMSRRITHVTPEQSVQEAVEGMLRQGVRALPVLGDKREVLGVVAQRDVMRALLPQIPRAGQEGTAGEAAARELSVRDIMSRSVLCITEDTGVEEVTNLMINKDVDQLPVVHEGRLTGIITRSDIIRKLFRA
jgi:CBS domain-containing protein